MTVWGQRLKNQLARDDSLLKLAGADRQSQGEARDFGKDNPGFSWTRRLLAFIAILSIVALPKVAAVWMPELQVAYGYTEFKSGFLFFSEGHSFTEWKSFTGLVITPLDTHLMSAIAGLYFGGSLVGHTGKR